MSILKTAQADFSRISSDTKGFALPITIIDTAGVEYDAHAIATDIHQVLDPMTGLLVSGRSASVTVSFEAVKKCGCGRPMAVADAASRPWTVEWQNAAGTSNLFKVIDVLPDSSIGGYVLMLEGVTQ